jgi:hypothetical protein
MNTSVNKTAYIGQVEINDTRLYEILKDIVTSYPLTYDEYIQVTDLRTGKALVIDYDFLLHFLKSLPLSFLLGHSQSVPEGSENPLIRYRFEPQSSLFWALVETFKTVYGEYEDHFVDYKLLKALYQGDESTNTVYAKAFFYYFFTKGERQFRHLLDYMVKEKHLRPFMQADGSCSLNTQTHSELSL